MFLYTEIKKNSYNYHEMLCMLVCYVLAICIFVLYLVISHCTALILFVLLCVY